MCWASVARHVMAGVKSSGPIRLVGGLAGSSGLRQSSANKLFAVSSQPQMLAWPWLPGGAFVLPIGVFGRNHDVLPGLQFFPEHAPLLVQVGQPAGLNGGLIGCLRFGGLQGTERPAGVAAAQFAVGLDGEPPAAFSEVVP